MFNGVYQVGEKWESAQESWAQNDAGHDLTNDFRLPEFYENVAQQLGQSDKKQEHEKN
jgi:hypothetical protein